MTNPADEARGVWNGLPTMTRPALLNPWRNVLAKIPAEINTWHDLKACLTEDETKRINVTLQRVDDWPPERRSAKFFGSVILHLPSGCHTVETRNSLVHLPPASDTDDAELLRAEIETLKLELWQGACVFLQSMNDTLMTAAVL